ncbi:Uncharacterized protein FWK35_00013731 [Aphis craccivora]|uniref:Uncharacterized protein n=1 Tax=Aphis craccivora TaxID=307492 RepID=A0A6G0YEC4_APHCR|nr:Uncharacterized protein FWK35_00013731 [Aphis craccivora]
MFLILIFKIKLKFIITVMTNYYKKNMQQVNTAIAVSVNVLKNYMDFNNQNAIILLWNGNSDKNILQRLGFNTNIKLNMTAYDTDINRVFYLKLINFQSYIIKNGRFLLLKETHDSICNQNHDITYIHDAVSDVKLTKCIFNYLCIKNNYQFNLIFIKYGSQLLKR